MAWEQFSVNNDFELWSVTLKEYSRLQYYVDYLKYI